MIKASFNYIKKSGTISMSIEGHAGQAPKGQDLICSAASILSYTVAQYLEFVEMEEGLTTPPRIEMEEGQTIIVANPTEEYLAEVLNAFFVAEVGYSLLAQNYPQYVELKMFGKAF